jgi:hypothetical protein
VRLGLGLGLGGSGANTLCLGALQMGCGYPALIVCLCARSNSRAVSPHNGDLVSGIDLLGAARRLLGALATLATALLLGEDGGDPGVVDEVDGSAEGAEDDQIEKYARRVQVSSCM